MYTLAVIPARGGSKGLKGKNIKILNKKPLLSYTIEAALQSSIFNRVIVSTDDEKIANVAIDSGVEVPFLRPKELASDTATTIDVLKHVITEVEEREGVQVEHVVVLQPTSPLRTSDHLRQAFELFVENEYIPVVSVCEARSNPYILKKREGKYLVDYVSNKEKVSRRQEYPEVFELNGAIYMTTREQIMNLNTIYQDKIIPYFMGKEDSVDIDDIVDFYLAEAIIRKRSESNV